MFTNSREGPVCASLGKTHLLSNDDRPHRNASPVVIRLKCVSQPLEKIGRNLLSKALVVSAFCFSLKDLNVCNAIASANYYSNMCSNFPGRHLYWLPCYGAFFKVPSESLAYLILCVSMSDRKHSCSKCFFYSHERKEQITATWFLVIAFGT